MWTTSYLETLLWNTTSSSDFTSQLHYGTHISSHMSRSRCGNPPPVTLQVGQPSTYHVKGGATLHLSRWRRGNPPHVTLKVWQPSTRHIKGMATRHLSSWRWGNPPPATVKVGSPSTCHIEGGVSLNLARGGVYPMWCIGRWLPNMPKVARSIPGWNCTNLYYTRDTQGVLPMRVGGLTSQLDLPSLMPLFVACCCRL